MSDSIEFLRNVAIVAHVDHGKTTLVDKLLRQSGTLDERGDREERVMDSGDIEKERGITILAKNTAIGWTDPDKQEWRINIVDTPGHADFGGEVERVLSMVDSVVLLVDAVEGPMPQTTFVTKKALAQGLRPIVVVNKIDRVGARPDWVVDQTFDLFDRLGATDEQLDFPVVYASALNGWASDTAEDIGTDMTPLFQSIVKNAPVPSVDPDAPLQLQVSALDYNSYTGVIGIGRVMRGTLNRNQQVIVASPDGKERKAKVLELFGFMGLDRVKQEMTRINSESRAAASCICLSLSRICAAKVMKSRFRAHRLSIRKLTGSCANRLKRSQLMSKPTIKAPSWRSLVSVRGSLRIWFLTEQGACVWIMKSRHAD